MEWAFPVAADSEDDCGEDFGQFGRDQDSLNLGSWFVLVC
jgi:hypothetical protein